MLDSSVTTQNQRHDGAANNRHPRSVPLRPIVRSDGITGRSKFRRTSTNLFPPVKYQHDLFAWLLITQALLEKLTLTTADEQLQSYAVNLILCD